ncbi:unnamed protein product, partial [Protopolystoma xenopodis]
TVENILEVRPDLCKALSGQGLFAWLLRRIQKRTMISSSNTSGGIDTYFDRNKLYAAEILHHAL